MNKKKVLIFLIFFGAFAGIIAGGFYFLSSNKLYNAKPDGLFGWKYPVAKFPSTGLGGQLAYSSIRDPGGMPQGLPTILKIPSIGVNSTIEDALITPDGRMDVPAGSVNVAWFALGPHPGQVGSAVIGGHFGIENGVPFVFYNLDKLKVGDKIYIIDDTGDTLAFIVRSIKSFDRNADAAEVFTSTDGLAHLNLITCEGIWNQVNGNYPQRLVIFTDAISPVANSVSVNNVFSRLLTVGTSGSDVATLQNILEEKRFLVMPKGVTKGFFGSLTRIAVGKYQTSVGLPSNGVFGPLTKVKLISQMKNSAVLPDAGTGENTILQDVAKSSVSRSVIQIIKNVYATPIDGIVTSILILLIGFVIFKIIRL